MSWPGNHEKICSAKPHRVTWITSNFSTFARCVYQGKAITTLDKRNQAHRVAVVWGILLGETSTLLQLSRRLRERPTSVDWLVCCEYSGKCGYYPGEGSRRFGVALVQRDCYLGSLFTASTSNGIGFGGILPYYYVCEGIPHLFRCFVCPVRAFAAYVHKQLVER
jgi:hypothetical protein